jgi:aldehyde:ferredoxin oxidoreductase
MPYGWVGKTLRVDLDKRETTIEPSEQFYRSFMGGKGINAKVLWDEVTPETEPFASDNRLIFGTGPLVGTLVPTGCKCSISSKSPLTGRYGDSNIGGYWPAELKYAGFDQIIVSGCADSPTYLFIEDGKVELRDAKNIWGKDTGETTRTIKDELKNDAKVLCIGPAGESRVVCASVVSWPSGCASRTGMGAVMGSKNLKAIAVRGSGDILIGRPKELIELCAQLAEGMRRLTAVIEDPAGEIAKESQHMLFGTHHEEPPPGWPGNQELIDAVHRFFKNYGAGNPAPCLNCPMPCKPQFKVPDPDGTYEYTYLHCDTWLIFTTRTKSAKLDLATDSRLFMKCQKLGIDIFSAASDVSFLMELYEKGIITEKDTDGVPLQWGDKEALGLIIEKIARREGIGGLFSEGIIRAAEQIGRGAEEFAYHTKGVELVHYSLYMIDAALAAAISQRGDQVRAHGATLMSLSANVPQEYLQLLTSSLPRHLAETVLREGYVERYEGKAGLVEHFERINSLSDILGVCRWWMTGAMLSNVLTPEAGAQLASYATGKDFDEQSMSYINERVESVIRAFNVREGLTRRDDAVPKFYFDKRSQRHGVKLDPEKFSKVLTDYYALRGWDKHGIPRKDRLEALGLDYVAEDLAGRGLM